MQLLCSALSLVIDNLFWLTVQEAQLMLTNPRDAFTAGMVSY